MTACIMPDAPGRAMYPFRQRSARGEPRPQTSIERRCRTCGASFIGLAAGKTGEAGIWHYMTWYCSVECAPAAVAARTVPCPAGCNDGEGAA